MGTLKPPPVPAIRKSVPPEVSPNFQLCVGSVPSRLRGFRFVPSGRDWRSLKTKRRLQMTDNKKETATSKTPNHIAYHVRNGNSDKGYWTRIGAARSEEHTSELQSLRH